MPPGPVTARLVVEATRSGSSPSWCQHFTDVQLSRQRLEGSRVLSELTLTNSDRMLSMH